MSICPGRPTAYPERTMLPILRLLMLQGVLMWIVLITKATTAVRPCDPNIQALGTAKHSFKVNTQDKRLPSRDSRRARPRTKATINESRRGLPSWWPYLQHTTCYQPMNSTLPIPLHRVAIGISLSGVIDHNPLCSSRFRCLDIVTWRCAITR